MSADTALVDEIVRRVLEHLQGPQAAARPASKDAAPQSPAGEVIVDAAVVTHELLTSAVNGSAAKRIRIGRRAILTPSARDFLRNREIDIVRQGGSQPGKANLRWQFIVTHSSPQGTAAIEKVRATGAACVTHLLGSIPEAAAQAISALCRGEADRVVVFTAAPEHLACLVNRNESVRGAATGDAASASRIRNTFQANLAAIDPSGKSAFELTRILQAFAN